MAIYTGSGARVIPRRGVYVTVSGEVNVTNGETKTVNWTSESWDYGGFWNLANPSRLTIPVAGIYQISGLATWDSINNIGVRGISFYLNGDTYINLFTCQPATDFITYQPMSAIRELTTIGDYIEMQVFQDSGATIDANSQGITHFSMILLQP